MGTPGRCGVWHRGRIDHHLDDAAADAPVLQCYQRRCGCIEVGSRVANLFDDYCIRETCLDQRTDVRVRQGGWLRWSGLLHGCTLSGGGPLAGRRRAPLRMRREGAESNQQDQSDSTTSNDHGSSGIVARLYVVSRRQ